MQADQIAKEQKEALKSNVPSGLQPKWYVIHIQTSYEGRVKQALEQRVKSLGVEDKIFDIVIPTREIIVVNLTVSNLVGQVTFFSSSNTSVAKLGLGLIFVILTL